MRKRCARSRRPRCSEVHDRERDLGHHVDPAQRRIELDAVEHDDAVLEQHHVREVQVAVAFAHEAEPQPLVHRGRDPAMRRVGPPLDRGDPRRDVGGVLQPAHVLEVGGRVRERGRGGPPRVGRRGARNLGVEARDASREFVHALGRQRIRREQAVELLRAVEPAHADRVLDAFAGAVDARRVRRAGDGRDAQVEIGRQPAVQPQFLLARGTPLRERGEVEEPQVERLLDLVGIVAGEHDPRDVRLDDLDVRRRMRKALRVAQPGRERRRVGGGVSHGVRRERRRRCASPRLLRGPIGEPVDRRVQVAHDVVDFIVGPA